VFYSYGTFGDEADPQQSRVIVPCPPSLSGSSLSGSSPSPSAVGSSSERVGPAIGQDLGNYDLDRSSLLLSRVKELEELGCFPAGAYRAARSNTMPQSEGR
jgi:hypothetical protein